MKNYFLLLIIPLLFFSVGCKKDCSCGEIVDTGIDDIFPWENPNEEYTHLYYLVVQNDCTNNIDTFYVDNIETYNYFENENIYCEGSW